MPIEVKTHCPARNSKRQQVKSPSPLERDLGRGYTRTVEKDTSLRPPAGRQINITKKFRFPVNASAA